MKIDYTRHYRKWHDDSPEHEALACQLYARILDGKLPADKSSRVLDVGCGMGNALLALRQLGYANLRGVDLDEGQVTACRNKGLDVELTTDTAALLQTMANQFDLVLCLDVIEHIPRDEQIRFVQALQAAIKPGGKLICSVPNANSALAVRWRYIDWTHHWSFTEHSLEFLLMNGGFSEVTIGEMEFNYRPRLWWLPISGGRHWWAFRFFRTWQRLLYMAELGPAQGRAVPLSLNLLAVASKPRG